MTQILDKLPANFSDRVFCCYTNDANEIMLVRIVNISNWYFERVIFPGEKLLFEALPEAELEVYTKAVSKTAPLKTILCDRLTVKERQAQFDRIA